MILWYRITRMQHLLHPGQFLWSSSTGMADFAKRFVSQHPATVVCKQVVDQASPIVQSLANDEVSPPVAPKRSHYKSMHGVTWDDPYHWMSNAEDVTLVEHLQNENKYCAAVMADTLKLQSLLKKEIASRMARELSSSFIPWGPWNYYSRVPEGKDYPVFYRRRRLEGTLQSRSVWQNLVAAAVGFKKDMEEVLIDQNLIAEEHGYAQLGMCKVSSDHQLLAFTVDVVGNELFTLFVKDLNTGQLLLHHTTEGVTSMEWSSNSRALYYTVPDNLLRPFRVLSRRIDTKEPDYLVFEESHPSYYVDVGRTKDWRFMTINVRSKNSGEVYLVDANELKAPMQLVERRRPGLEYFVEHHNGFLYILTNFDTNNVANDCGNLRLVRCPITNRSPKFWQVVVPVEPGTVIVNMDMFKNHLVLYERMAVSPQIRVFEMPLQPVDKISGISILQKDEQLLSSKSWRLQFPEDVCTITPGANPDFHSSVLQVQLSSPSIPEAFLGYDLAAGAVEVLEQEEVFLGNCGESIRADQSGTGLDSKPEHLTDSQSVTRSLINLSHLYLCTRREAVSHDGVSVPVTIVQSRKLQVGSQSPALLVGYGAYCESLEVDWSIDQLSLLDRGWVLAFAHVRGGGELGRSWYHTGSLMDKKNSFHDFIACAQFLLEQGYAHRDKLCAYGTSAGGLLVAASVNQQPSLFRAAILKVPFLDICNTMLDASLPLTVHEYDEWGNPNNPATFSYVRSYSPCDNIVRGGLYPAMLVTASTSDTRVGYWEALKWVAAVRETTQKDPRRPIIFKTIPGGHFGEGGRHQRLAMTAFEYSFLIKMTESDSELGYMLPTRTANT